jgi:hypothetical protein
MRGRKWQSAHGLPDAVIPANRCRHSRESGIDRRIAEAKWIPAFAGMTAVE